MSSLFAVEMAHWHEAQAAGVPLTEHLTQIGDLTTPISESEFIEPLELDAEEDEEEEDDEPSTLIPMQATVAGTVRERHNTPPPTPRRDQTPAPRPMTPATGVPHPMSHTPSAGIRRPSAATATGAATAVRSTEVALPDMVATVIDSPSARNAISAPNPWPASTTPGSGVRSPASGPQQIQASRDSVSGKLATMTMKLYGDIPPLDPVAADRTRKIAIYAGGAVLLAIVIVAIAMGGGGGSKPAAALPPEDNAASAPPVTTPDAAVMMPVATDAAVEPVSVSIDAAVEEPPVEPVTVKKPDKKPERKKPGKPDKKPDKKGPEIKPDINDVMPPPRR
jgi:hypothetical protein